MTTTPDSALILVKYPKEEASIIEILHDIQLAHRHIPKDALSAIAAHTDVPLSRVYGVATFYSQFHLTPRGRHIIQQCDGTACHVRGAARIIAAVERELGIKAGETTPDLKCTYEVVYCIGSCALAPTAMIDDRVARGLTPEKMLDIIKNLD